MKFKINSNKTVLDYNRDNIFPMLTHREFKIRSVSFSPESEIQLDKLRAKYKLSRSALLRILIEQADLNEQK